MEILPDTFKKKRGRKPKNFTIEEITPPTEKKKRGRKKKYEVENFEKILNRNEENNFNHHVVYSDDESTVVENSCVKKIAFGNLDIMVSKKVQSEDINDFKFKTRAANSMLINENEYSSDEEKEVPIESFIKMNEKHYSENKKYIPKAVSECTSRTIDSVKKIKVITTTKDQIKCSTDWPETCDVCCWWCCHNFEGSPCTLPIKYDQAHKRFTFIGIFCSWNCVKSYNFERADHRKYEQCSLITLLVQQLYGITEAIRIKPAPPRQCLRMFGGYMDIDEFRDQHKTVDSYNMNLLKFNYIYPEVTEISSVKTKHEKKNLRLSRPKNEI
jgi:hypothetical protein